MAKRVVEVFYELRDLFTGKIKKITSGYDDLRKTSGRTAEKIERDNKRAAGSFTKLTGVVSKLRSAWFTLSGLLAGGAVFSQLSRAADELDRLGKTANRLGLSANDLAAFEFAGERVGISASKISAAIETLQKRTGEAEKGIGRAKIAFDTLNISIEDFSKLDIKEKIALLAEEYNKLSTNTQKAAVRSQLFSKANSDIGNLLSQGAEGVKFLTNEYERLNGVITPEAVKNAEDYKDAIKNLTTAAEGFRNKVAPGALGATATALNTLTGTETIDTLTTKLSALYEVLDLSPGIQRTAALLFLRKSLQDVRNEVFLYEGQLKRLLALRDGPADLIDPEEVKKQEQATAGFTAELTKLTGQYKESAKAAESALDKETQELEAARQKQLNIEKEFADLRKNVTAPEDEDVSGLDVQLAILEAKTKLQQGQIQGAIDSARDAGGLLESLKEDGEESGFVLSFLAKEIERVANAAAQKNVAAELVDKEQAEQAANTLKAQLQSLTEEAPKLGAEAGQAYIEAFQQALNAKPPALPQPAAPQAPAVPIRRNGNSFSDGTDFNDAIEREGAK